MSTKKGFFAYPSSPEDLNETIEVFIREVNHTGIIKIKSWKELSINGSFIIDSILQEIDEADLFLCDLTYLNANVLFELGYAISKNKKIWIALNPSVDSSRRDYEKLKILTTIGYASYSNSNHLIKEFYSEMPFENLENTIFSKVNPPNQEIGKLVYLKSIVESDASLNVSIKLKDNSLLPVMVDDPREMSTQTLSWYYNYLFNTHGVVVHLASERQVENKIINLKYALISGLAYGMQKPLLMLAHDPYNSPIDFKDILRVHSTAKQCEEELNKWLEPIKEEYKVRKNKYGTHLKDKKALTELSNLFIGEPIAEHEHDNLSEYFFETREYLEALNAQQTLFIGRKGTGKTANFYKIADELAQDKRNFVCIVQPVGHEIDGVLGLLKQQLSNSERGFLVESIWKFLIYTELAKSVFESYERRPNNIPHTKEESEFIQFVTQHEKMINADFTLRLENAVSQLKNISECQSIESHRVKVSEILHDRIIAQLRKKLGDVLGGKNKVSILMDNLDASWNNRSDLPQLCDLLFGLLNVLKKITDDFNKGDYRHKKVNLSLIAFLRSDIFNQILTYANERDKIQHSKLVWQDIDLLFRIIEGRIRYSLEGITSPTELWNNYFCSEVNNIPLKQYVENLILPRPRDIIFLFRGAIQEAVNRGHIKVEESDFLSAESKYSQYAIESLLPENGNRLDDFESLLYEFAGSNEIILITEIEDILRNYKLTNTAEVIDILCELTFLGLEISPGKFEFINEQRSKKIVHKLARKTVEQSQSKIQRYKIHKAFHSYLEILTETEFVMSSME